MRMNINKVYYYYAEDDSGTAFELLSSNPDEIYNVYELTFDIDGREVVFENRLGQLPGFCKNNELTYKSCEFEVATVQPDLIVLTDQLES